jgi:hypothetical protein
MTQYGKDNKRTSRPCWGCGSSGHHSFANCTTIACPNKEKTGIMERAAEACKEFKEKLPVRRKAQSKRDQTKGGSTELLSKLSSTQIKVMSPPADQLSRLLISGADKSPSKKP